MTKRPWTAEFDARTREWCTKVAALAVDALINAGSLTAEGSELTTTIVSEEIYVRLCLLDYPPQPESP